MNNLKQIQHDVVYNFIYEIQHIESGEGKYAFFTDEILNNMLLHAIKSVTYDLNTVINFDNSKLSDDDLKEKIASAPSSLQAPIVLRAAISLIDHFIQVIGIDSEVIDVMHNNSEISDIRETFKVNLAQYRSLYSEIISDLKEYAEQNGIELSNKDRVEPIVVQG